jgi:mitogen-activated protein kinase kinase kinase
MLRGVHELVSPGPSTATVQNLQPSNTSYSNDVSRTPSHRHNTSSTSLGGMSPSEAAIQWPLERVLAWLSKNGFSKDWQETFKALEIQGADFIELGHGSNGRGNLGKMHQVVYPQLQKECAKSGTGWDQSRERREREEGLRMRKLIRQIHDDGNGDTTNATHRRRGSQSLLTSASTDGGLENSPNFGWDPLSVTYSGGSMENNFSEHPAHRAPSSNKYVQPRSVTAPVVPKSDSAPGDLTGPDSTSHIRSEYSRQALASLDEFRRQSPSASSDGAPFPPPTFRTHEDSPQSGSPTAQHAFPVHPGLTSSSTGDLLGRYEHSRGNSTDSIAGTGRGTSPMPRFYEGRKQTQDSARSSTQDPKEHGKSFLNIFKKKSKSNDSYPSPEEQSLESPTSPVYTRQNGSYSPFMRPAYNNSDMSLGDRPLSGSMSDYEKGSTRGKIGPKGKRYAFATLDCWNYRLVDITDVDTPEGLRAVICQNLGILDWPGAQIFFTEPGQIEHDEPLNDTALALSRRAKSDSVGSLKFYVRGTLSQMASSAPHFTGLGVSFPEKNTPSPISGQHHFPRKPVDGDHAQPKPVSPSLGSRQTTVKASSANSASHASTPSLPESAVGDSSQESSVDFLARQEEYKREVERKQNVYFRSKQPPPLQPRKDVYGDTGYRREGVIDFDSPRISPFEDKKPENLVPLRKPPSAPTESTTLTKVNSLSKRPQHTETSKQRQHGFISEETTADPSKPSNTPIAAALASAGQMATAIGTPATSVSPGGHASRPTHAAVDNNSSTNKSSGKTPTTTSKAVGPEYDFEETKVFFQHSPLPNAGPGGGGGDDDGDDDDSDKDLFIKPLANRNQSKGKEPVSNSSETTLKPRKPSLTVNTAPRSTKGLSVSFKSPSTVDEMSAGRSFQSSSALPSDLRAGYGGFSGSSNMAIPTGFPSHSPEDERFIRRDSFARDDIWASRPPVQGVIDHLDDFFPNIDLDEPYLEATAVSPPVSPTGHPSRDMQGSYSSPSQAVRNGSDILGSNESTLKNPVAQRNVNRSGGLTRMKSIREVAKGAQVNRNRSVHTPNNPKSGEILRRKSTKMFGAKIMQISPKPGSRLSQLDPIPQNSVPQDNIPRRQQTFRIIRGQLIGKGTFGRVYLGINADTGDVLAVKQVEVNAKVAGQDKDRIKEMVAAMDQEIDTMQHLEHPNIVQYLGCERGEFSISIYLEYISGGSIGSCLRKHGKFEESVVKSLTRQTLEGLAYLHDQGILHRDLKADNILLDLDGTCKISDFGISKKTDNIYGNDASNSMQGSIFWMAPEVVQSQGQGYSAKVDIWSLGCVVLEMFAGRRPWSKEEAIGAIFKLGSLSQAPPIPEDVAVNISPAALAFMYDCFTM